MNDSVKMKIQVPLILLIHCFIHVSLCTELSPTVAETTRNASVNVIQEALLPVKTETQLKPSDYRLPHHLVPTQYLVRLQPSLGGNFSIDGYVEISLLAAQPTTKIVLHIKDILMKNETASITTIDGKEIDGLKIKSQTYDLQRNFYVATLNQVLTKGKTYVFKIFYTGYLNDNLKGFYRSSYVDANGDKRWLATTQFQPTKARLAFPCLDEPALKAKFIIEMVRNKNMTSISNLPLQETLQIPEQPDMEMDRFQNSVKMSTYLVAFMVSDFKFIRADVHNETFLRVWTRPSEIHKAEYALETGKKVLLFFENYFNISYPLPKTDMVALPDFGPGAMENWGLINYRETALLYNSTSSSASTKKKVGGIIAHELAHQWFGNLVTPNWWTDIWLNEGFATWMAAVSHNELYLEKYGRKPLRKIIATESFCYKLELVRNLCCRKFRVYILHKKRAHFFDKGVWMDIKTSGVEPSMKIMDRFVQVILGAMVSDSLVTSHPISIPVGHPDEISEIFDAISYSKGASILRMTTHFLSEKTFIKGVSRYLKNYAYSDATQDDLWHFLTIQGELDQTLPSGVNVKEVLDTWTLQMGYPIVNVSVNSNGTVMMTQERFLRHKADVVTDDHDYKWWIPITYATQSKPDFMATTPSIWMKPSESSKILQDLPGLTNDSQWFVFNNLLTGFYRVNYPIDNWNKIIDQFKANYSVFPTFTRAQLIGDAFHIAKSGLLNYSVPLSLFFNLKYETEYSPMAVSLYDSGFLRRILKYTEFQSHIENLTLNMIEPHYKALGFNDLPTDSHIEESKRAMIIPTACNLEHPQCVQSASHLFQEWMIDPNNITLISRNLESTVYCTGIKFGGQKEWDFAWEQYNVTTIETQKKRILTAFGCSKNETLRTEFLDIMFKQDSPVRKQDITSAFRSITRDKEGSLKAWSYLQENYDAILEYVGGKKSNLINFVRTASSFVKTRKDLDELYSFITTKKDLQGPGTRSIDQLKENLVGDIQWLEDNLSNVGSLLTLENSKSLLI